WHTLIVNCDQLLAKNHKPIEISILVRKAIQNKRRGKLSSKILFLHDNARPHTANRTREVLNAFKWEIFPHPPYSPDLAPSNYHLFPRMKTWLGTQRFDDNAELLAGVTDWFKSQAAEFYDSGITKLVHRYDKCLTLFGEYVEK
uniref:Tc1-like transposase DDE domain-containing protein n=1 Tax=Pseudonaja textilis TaxID=8673 RepID=A0A670YEL7_PSETE